MAMAEGGLDDDSYVGRSKGSLDKGKLAMFECERTDSKSSACSDPDSPRLADNPFLRQDSKKKSRSSSASIKKDSSWMQEGKTACEEPPPCDDPGRMCDEAGLHE